MNKKIISYASSQVIIGPIFFMRSSDYKIDCQINGKTVYVCFLWYTEV
jgi:hypothetical protein